MLLLNGDCDEMMRPRRNLRIPRGRGGFTRMKIPAVHSPVNSIRRVFACAFVFAIGACTPAAVRSPGAAITRLDGATIDTTALTSQIDRHDRAPQITATPGATTVVVVRHAEKSTDDPQDPSLSATGQERARLLTSVLKNAGVTSIYTTQYKRTRQTAEPLAQQLGIAIV